MSERDTLRTVFSRGQNCLSPADLEAVAFGTASEAARQHASNCPHCTSEAAMLKAFVEAEPSELEATAVRQVESALKREPRWKPAPAQGGAKAGSLFGAPWFRWALGGLAVVLAVGVFLQRPASETRPFPGAGVTRSVALEVSSPLGDLSEPPSTLRWRPVTGAARYAVKLQEVDGATLWEQDASAPEIPLPQPVRALMTDRKTLLWEVRALDASGAVLATSPTSEFRVIRSAK